jgi:hypothetical protein
VLSTEVKERHAYGIPSVPVDVLTGPRPSVAKTLLAAYAAPVLLRYQMAGLLGSRVRLRHATYPTRMVALVNMKKQPIATFF